MMTEARTGPALKSCGAAQLHNPDLQASLIAGERRCGKVTRAFCGCIRCPLASGSHPLPARLVLISQHGGEKPVPGEDPSMLARLSLLALFELPNLFLDE